MRFCKKPLRFVVEGVGHVRHAAALRCLGQFTPSQLFLDRVRPLNDEPMVHGACRARPDAAHAVVTAFRVDNVVPLVADRLGGAAETRTYCTGCRFPGRSDVAEMASASLCLSPCEIHSPASSPFLGCPRQGLRFHAPAALTAEPLPPVPRWAPGWAPLEPRSDGQAEGPLWI